MPTANDVMKVAENFIGTKESPPNSNNVIFNTDYYGHAVSGVDYPWCCAFVWDVFRIAGASNLFYNGNRTAYCPTYESWALDAGLSVGKDNGQYGDVATMDFGKGRASHIGFIKQKNADGTYQTIEGNTSLTSQDNGGAVMERTRNKSVIRNIFRPKYTGGGEVNFTLDQFINAISKVAQMAQKGHWRYGDSHALPPCSDGIISCDRLVARGLWDLGFRDQPRGGITVLNMGEFLLSWNFQKITKQSDLQRGDIVLMKANGTSAPTPAWHTFVLTAYNASTQICSKYDEGSQSRIDAGGFFANVPLNEWSNKTFYCAFRATYKDKEPKRLKPKGTKYNIESQINKGYCLDVKSGSIDESANIQLWKKNKTPAQQFCIEDVKDGYVRIVNVKSGLVVDLYGAQAKNKNNIHQYEWNGSKAQLWKLRLNADMTITVESAVDNQYVIDCAGGKAVNGTNIQIYKNNDSKAQKWKLVKVE